VGTNPIPHVDTAFDHINRAVLHGYRHGKTARDVTRFLLVVELMLPQRRVRRIAVKKNTGFPNSLLEEFGKPAKLFSVTVSRAISLSK
jgi:hypothetical protein